MIISTGSSVKMKERADELFQISPLMITELPVEMIIHIFSFMDGWSLQACRSVCRSWNIILEGGHLWELLCKKEDLKMYWSHLNEHEEPLDHRWRNVWIWHQMSRHPFQAGEVKEGFGTFADSEEGTTYLGQWKENKKHGWGKFVWGDSSRYEGQWFNDKRTGFGTYFWLDGRYFVGYHCEDKRFNGKFYWPAGSSYEGQYKNGSRDGAGTFTWPDGDSYQGTWREGGRFESGIYRCVQKGKEGEFPQTWNEVEFDFNDRGPTIGKRKIDDEPESDGDRDHEEDDNEVRDWKRKKQDIEEEEICEIGSVKSKTSKKRKSARLEA
eukprot:TRINITY_DN9220_c0_g1_i1.p1 TRINITY_DN9220_c0_g1~~TRINITY_DN9220_c0_g1_i1.p1  ORF type:complete len:324 (-),score=74.96 TRINITY_DN9220_c0_g1_i1:5-976(-)